MNVRDTVARWCERLGIPTPDSDAWQKLMIFRSELLHWNRRVNLTADRDPDRLLFRHVLDSLVPLAVLPEDLQALMDIGSGGGFPGIPLAICRRNTSLLLVERVARKCAWLRAVSRKLALPHVTVAESDLDTLQPDVPLKWAITRAVRVDHRLCRRLAAIGVEKLVTFDSAQGAHSVLAYRLPDESKVRWISVVPVGKAVEKAREKEDRS